MSLSKLCFFSALVMAVAFAAVRRFDVQIKELGIPTSNSPSRVLAVPQNESLWHVNRPVHEVVRSNWESPAKSATLSTVFLPMQSQNPKDFGTGKLLVASRALADPSFAQTVILLVHADAEGVVGLILNRRTKIPLSRALDQFEAAKGRSDKAYLGGPVETPAVLALLRSTDKLDGAERVMLGVYWISAKTPFEKAISARPGPDSFHVYLGYAGWNNDQLRKEIEQGSWFIFPGDAQTIFDSDPDSMWRQMIHKTELRLAGSAPPDARSSASTLTFF